MIKIFLSILLVVLCTFAGGMFARKYRKRRDFFYEFDRFNARLIDEVSYTRKPFSALLGEGEAKGDLAALVAEKGEKGYVAESAELAYLTEGEKNFVRDYFLMVGRSDATSQREYLCSVRARAERLKEESGAECKRRNELYGKLGFLFGLVVAVILA